MSTGVPSNPESENQTAALISVPSVVKARGGVIDPLSALLTPTTGDQTSTPAGA